MTVADVQECHEEVEDPFGYCVPCERTAVGYRIDSEDGRPYPVCQRHLRAPIFVPDYSAVQDNWQERQHVSESATIKEKK